MGVVGVTRENRKTCETDLSNVLHMLERVDVKIRRNT